MLAQVNQALNFSTLHNINLLFLTPKNVVNLMRAVSLVNSLVTTAIADEFSHNLQRLVSPDVIGQRLVTTILSDQKDEGNSVHILTQELSTRLQQVFEKLKICFKWLLLICF